MEWHDEQVMLPAQPENVSVRIHGSFKDKEASLTATITHEDLKWTMTIFEKRIDDEDIEPEILHQRFTNKINKLKKMNFISLLVNFGIDDEVRRRLTELSLDSLKANQTSKNHQTRHQ